MLCPEKMPKISIVCLNFQCATNKWRIKFRWVIFTRPLPTSKSKTLIKITEYKANHTQAHTMNAHHPHGRIFYMKRVWGENEKRIKAKKTNKITLTVERLFQMTCTKSNNNNDNNNTRHSLNNISHNKLIHSTVSNHRNSHLESP